MRIEIRDAPFDPWAEMARYERESLAGSGRHGACAVFVGTMRDFNEGDAVRGMTLEHYPGMTERHLSGIASEAMTRFGLMDTLILHRIGALSPGEPIVLCAVWSAHRAAALEACRFLIEDLKSRAPFWKRETLDSSVRWVERNTQS
ncbi:MAG: molybdenum cofactor biosynthesis protein MoaE [Pseudomonadota bacterium]|nr:molybdenum cofactor biosynthesis protein MoaE [Pseudomonadota bacterium]